MRQGKNKNDLWSAYRYGKQIKVVYYKVGKNTKGFELPKKPKLKTGTDGRFDESVSRTKATIFEIAACNDFKWFVTLTLDSEKKNRNDLKSFSRDFGQFIRDQNKKREKREKIEYLVIPEQHKDGAWHMHGLFKGLTEKDLVKNEFGYLDWLEYRNRFGFFSCSKIKSLNACSKYITKYVTKDVKKNTSLQSGAHSFYASKGLKRREVLVYCSADKLSLFDDVREFDFENDYVKIAWFNEANFNELTFLGK